MIPTASAVQPEIPTQILGANSSAPIPSVEGIWSIFVKKGIRTVFASVGVSSSCQADLEIAEALGCPIHTVALSEEGAEQWKEVAAIAKARERAPENSRYAFSEGAEEKWVLVKNFRPQSAVPWWYSGTVDCSGLTLQTKQFTEWVESINSAMGIKETRLDILKLDVPYGLERSILYAMLESGFRPALIFVRWTNLPDVDNPTTLCAGHLQNTGYQLIEKLGNAFCYYYTDQDVYMLTSWEKKDVANPLLAEITRSVQKTLSKLEAHKLNAARHASDAPVPTRGETVVDAEPAQAVHRTESV